MLLLHRRLLAPVNLRAHLGVSDYRLPELRLRPIG